MAINWTADDLAAIEAAIAKGVLRVEYNDRTVVYRSIKELVKLNTLNNLIAIRQNP